MMGEKNGLDREDTRTRFYLKMKGKMVSIEMYKTNNDHLPPK